MHVAADTGLWRPLPLKQEHPNVQRNNFSAKLAVQRSDFHFWPERFSIMSMRELRSGGWREGVREHHVASRKAADHYARCYSNDADPGRIGCFRRRTVAIEA